MRLVTFELATPLGPQRRLGLWRSRTILDVNTAYAALLARTEDRTFARQYAAAVLPPDMLGYFRAGERGRAALAEVAERWSAEGGLEGAAGASDGKTSFAEGEVRLLAPVPRPNTVRDFSTFEQHQQRVTRAKGNAEVPAAWYEIPVYWKANPENVVGPGADICWPAYAEQLDYELEFGVFIGRAGRDIPKSQAADYIAGYTIFNDISARDRQAKESVMTFGPAKGKDFDTSKVLGPCLVTPDEFSAARHRMTARINGELWSEGWTSDMYWSFASLIAYISESETLLPGDFLGSGACGTGCGLELGRWIQPGDVVELSVEGIGTIRNRLVRAGSPGANHRPA
jgi:2-keto-4-pentenoate hydratase/2-oxohepta-3-ene-1,7-dioic acid hydratase in catechol pathway